MPYTPSTAIISGSTPLNMGTPILSTIPQTFGGFLPSNIFDVAFVRTTAIQPVYRGKLGGEYVYSVGSIPIGASDIIIVGYE